MTRSMNCWVLLKTHSYTMRKIIQRIVSAFHLDDITGLGPTSRLIKTPHHHSITLSFTRNLSHNPVACLPCAGAMLTCTCRVILAQGRCLPAHARTPSLSKVQALGLVQEDNNTSTSEGPAKSASLHCDFIITMRIIALAGDGDVIDLLLPQVENR